MLMHDAELDCCVLDHRLDSDALRLSCKRNQSCVVCTPPSPDSHSFRYVSAQLEPTAACMCRRATAASHTPLSVLSPEKVRPFVIF